MNLTQLRSLFTKSKVKSERDFIRWLKSTTGFHPRNVALYQQAFSHSSAAEKKSGNKISNERLEFLGDAVLGSIVADYLFKRFPFKDEGFLTQLRSKIVNGQNLKELALKFGFDQQLKASLSKDEKAKSSAYGDAFEAFIGALYLDHGYRKTQNFVVTRIVNVHLDLENLISTNEDYKSQLQILCQKNKFTLEYKLISEEKIGLNKLYQIEVWVNNKPYTRFENFSKKVAEQKAAHLTLETLLKEIG